jgi:hypothetical protein
MDTAGAVEYVIGTGIDVTEQRQAEQTLVRQYQQTQLLSEMTRRIRESLEIGEILHTAATEARELLDCDRVFIISNRSMPQTLVSWGEPVWAWRFVRILCSATAVKFGLIAPLVKAARSFLPCQMGNNPMGGNQI